MDSLLHSAPVDSKIVKENCFVASSKIITEIVSKADVWIRQCPQPYWLRNSQGKLSHATSEIINEIVSRADAWIC